MGRSAPTEQQLLFASVAAMVVVAALHENPGLESTPGTAVVRSSTTIGYHSWAGKWLDFVVVASSSLADWQVD